MTAKEVKEQIRKVEEYAKQEKLNVSDKKSLY